MPAESDRAALRKNRLTSLIQPKKADRSPALLAVKWQNLLGATAEAGRETQMSRSAFSGP